MNEPTMKKTPMAGRAFHTLSDDFPQTVDYQGEVIEQVDSHHFLVQLFSWLGGDPTTQYVLSVEEMASVYPTSGNKRFQFFDSMEQANEYYEAKRSNGANFMRDKSSK